MPDTRPSTVAVIGGGLAGLAAGCALSHAGYRVTVLERRPHLGGRASSYEHPGTGEVIDNCQHVLLGCCTNLIDFYRRIGVEKEI
nr:FAD-dependent oxidoreductase [Terriglobales bacterium]